MSLKFKKITKMRNNLYKKQNKGNEIIVYIDNIITKLYTIQIQRKNLLRSKKIDILYTVDIDLRVYVKNLEKLLDKK